MFPFQNKSLINILQTGGGADPVAGQGKIRRCGHQGSS